MCEDGEAMFVNNMYYISLKLTLMSGDSSTTTMGSLGCGSGRTVTVRILELITAGGLWRRSTENIFFDY